MFGVMTDHYAAIKNQLGLDDALAPSSEDEKDEYIRKWTTPVLTLSSPSQK